MNSLKFGKLTGINVAFAPAGGIQDLRFDEVEKLSGAEWSWGGVVAFTGALSLAAGGAGGSGFTPKGEPKYEKKT